MVLFLVVVLVGLLRALVFVAVDLPVVPVFDVLVFFVEVLRVVDFGFVDLLVADFRVAGFLVADLLVVDLLVAGFLVAGFLVAEDVFRFAGVRVVDVDFLAFVVLALLRDAVLLFVPLVFVSADFFAVVDFFLALALRLRVAAARLPTSFRAAFLAAGDFFVPPPPFFSPPPVSLLTVAQARPSASPSLTPLSS